MSISLMAHELKELTGVKRGILLKTYEPMTDAFSVCWIGDVDGLAYEAGFEYPAYHNENKHPARLLSGDQVYFSERYLQPAALAWKEVLAKGKNVGNYDNFVADVRGYPGMKYMVDYYYNMADHSQ